MTLKDAEKTMRRIKSWSAGNQNHHCKLLNEHVFVTPLAGNAFQITSWRGPHPENQASYQYLKQIGADIKTEAVGNNMRQYVAVVTYDSMLHYLVLNEKLKV